MQSKSQKKGPDIINELLEDCLLAFPVSGLLISLYQQYGKRGFLTKKQMEGLLAKAQQAPGLSTAKIATLEAMIKRLPNRYKSEKPGIVIEQKDETSLKIADEILAKYPQHKRVLFLKMKIERDEISPAELTELQKFYKLLK